MVETIDHHAENTMKAASEPAVEKFFNLSKNSKEDAPLDGFINYYAYKIEERKYALRYPMTAA